MSSTTAETCARAIPDRRRRPTPIFSRYWLRGRRRGGRRAGESERIYVDGYAPIEWGLVFSLLLLSGIDLVLTFAHVEAGGGEANPLMVWVLATGGGPGFAAAKILLTGSATVFLLLHARFRLARHALEALVSVYFVLLGWHAFVALDRLTL